MENDDFVEGKMGMFEGPVVATALYGCEARGPKDKLGKRIAVLAMKGIANNSSI